MQHNTEQQWSQDGYFLDRDKNRVKAYDDVSLLVTTANVKNGTVLINEIIEGTIGTVFFHSDRNPTLLEIECDVKDGIAFAINYPSDKVLLVRTTEEKWGKQSRATSILFGLPRRLWFLATTMARSSWRRG